MAKSRKSMEKPEIPDTEAWRRRVEPDDAPAGNSEEAADDAVLRLYAEMVQHAIHPDPDSSC
ncbi:hypothetical protein GCM10011396_52980 [Undibacterium terreum]|uniref:Uncharacterized protein n=2 Tax=Undibacterium terreum TaxID=1224302 RepID=A0A916V027_9BURK|nr:hypothetical protein GCM10011396_52980 [Undibacterium terreum]